MKHRDLIVSTITNLEQQLDAAIHFGDSMETSPKKSHALRNAALGAGLVGASVAGALHGHGARLALPHGAGPRLPLAHNSHITRGAKDVMGHLKTGVKTIQGHVERAADRVKSMMKRTTPSGRETIYEDGLHNPNAYGSILKEVTNLSARVDGIINFDSDEDDDNNPNPWATVGKTAAAGTAGLYAAGAAPQVKSYLTQRNALLKQHAGDPEAAASAIAALKKPALGLGKNVSAGWGALKGAASGVLKHGLSSRVPTTQFQEKKNNHTGLKIAGAAGAGAAAIAAGLHGHGVRTARAAFKHDPATAIKHRSAVAAAAHPITTPHIKTGAMDVSARAKDVGSHMKAGAMHSQNVAKEHGQHLINKAKSLLKKKEMSARFRSTDFNDMNGGSAPLVQKQKIPNLPQLKAVNDKMGLAATIGKNSALLRAGDAGADVHVGSVNRGQLRVKPQSGATIAMGKPVRTNTKLVMGTGTGARKLLAAVRR